MSVDFRPIIPDPAPTPNRGNYTDLQPFRFWCQKVLPLVYDESLSYYELLCKVVDYLNKTMEDVGVLNDDIGTLYDAFTSLTGWTEDQVEALLTAYSELQDYVNNYFDNLNVQTEINNKLDALVRDGTLTELVSPFIPGAVETWLSSHVDPSTGYVVDNTLSIAGAAADAKATGDAIKNVKDSIGELNFILIPEESGVINTDADGWMLKNNANYKHKVIKVNGGETITFVSNENGNTTMLGLTAYSYPETAADTLTHPDTAPWNAAIQINPYTSGNEYIVPSSVKWLVISTKINGTDVTPASFKINGYDVCKTALNTFYDLFSITSQENTDITDLKNALGEVNFTLIPEEDGVINTDADGWMLRTNSNYKHKVVKINGGETIKFVSNENGNTTMLGLTAYSHPETAADTLTHPDTAPWNAAIQINPYTSGNEYIVPSSVKWLVISTKINGTDVTPASFKINGYDISANVYESISKIDDSIFSVSPKVATLEHADTSDLIADAANHNAFSYGGIDYTYENGKWHIEGTSTNSFYNIITENQDLPVTPGRLYWLEFETTDNNIKLTAYFYDDSNNEIRHDTFTESGWLEVPSTTDSLLLRIGIASGVVVDDDINRLQIYKYRPIWRDDLYHAAPKIIVFKDDDTKNDDSVQKYHDACRHNGFFGNYTIITKMLEQGYTTPSKLIGYEEEGFGMITHCYSQGSNDYWVNHETEECREDLAKSIRQLREWGFIDPFEFWQYPGGNVDNDAKIMCRDYGFKALGGQSVYSVPATNKIETFDRWNVKTYSMKENDAASAQSLAGAKDAIDRLVNSNGGLLVLTTHMSEWTALEYDDTLDEDGYPVGYARFNELAQYAINSNCQIMTINNALAILEKYYS